MLKIEITADNFEELKRKTFEALGLKEPSQMKLFTQSDTTSPSDNTSPSDVKSPTRHRRTKAEIEAAKIAELKNEEKAPEENTQERSLNKKEEKEAVEEVPEESVSEAQGEGESEENIDLAACQNVLRTILRTPGKGTLAATTLLGRFNVGKLTLMDPKNYKNFYKEAYKVLDNG